MSHELMGRCFLTIVQSALLTRAESGNVYDSYLQTAHLDWLVRIFGTVF